MMQYSYTIILLLVISGWFSGILIPAFSKNKGDLAIDFILPEEAIAHPHTIGGNHCHCIKYPPEETPLTPLIPKLSHRVKQSIQSHKLGCSSLPSSVTNWHKRCHPNLQRNPPRGGLTSHALPSFFIYTPKTTATVGDFLLLEHLENGQFKELYYNQFPLPLESGIVRILSPITLEKGKTYEWHLAIICDPDDRNADVIAVGTIKRIPLSPQLQSRIDRAPLVTKLQIYGEAGLWYDFFALLTENQQRSPIFREAWQTILQREFGQDSQIPQAKILSCCSTIARDN